MDRNELEEYKRELALIESKLTDDVVKSLTREELQEYITLVSKIKARLDILENL